MRTIPKPTIIQVMGYYPPHLGGAERVAQSLSEQLARRGYNVRVLTSDVLGKAGDDRSQPNLRITRLRALEFAHTPFAPGFIPAIFRTPRRNSIIHLHLAQAFYPELVFLAAKLKRIPYVVHFHLDLQPSGSLGKLFVIYKAVVIPVVIRQADRVVVFSAEQRQFIHSKYGVPERKIAVIPNGVGAEYYLQPRTYPQEGRRLLNVGRLSPQKRLHLLIEAVALLSNKVELTLVGDGEERGKLEALTNKLGLQNVTFTGAKTPQETLAYYKTGDVFVLPSEIEGMPLVLPEAMASGLPVVGAQVKGITEWVEGVGVLVEEPTGPKLAKKLGDLLQKPARLEQLSKQSFAAAQQYSWQRLTDSFEALYKQLLK